MLNKKLSQIASYKNNKWIKNFLIYYKKRQKILNEHIYKNIYLNFTSYRGRIKNTLKIS